MDAPPSRYRVVERGARLVVIDSVAGGAPPTARDLLPDDREGFSIEPYPRESGDPESPTTPPVILDSRLRGNTNEDYATPPSPSALTQDPPGPAATVAGARRNDRGRLLWTTARWYDAKAPRTLTLSAVGERRLGNTVAALLIGSVLAVILVAVGGVIGWVIVFATFMLARQAKPLATAWVDRLART